MVEAPNCNMFHSLHTQKMGKKLVDFFCMVLCSSKFNLTLLEGFRVLKKKTLEKNMTLNLAFLLNVGRRRRV